MFCPIVACFLIPLVFGPETTLFGDIRVRSAAAVAAELDAVANMPQAAFDQSASSIMHVVTEARPIALRIRAVDVVCSRASTQAATELVAYLNQSLNGSALQADPALGIVVHAFASGDLSRWSSDLKGASATTAFLVRLATWPGKEVEQPTCVLAADAALEIASSIEEKRAVLLQIVARSTQGSYLKPMPALRPRLDSLVNGDVRASIRQTLMGPTVNLLACLVIGEVGDPEALPALQHQRDLSMARGNYGLNWIDTAILYANLQNPPSRLLQHIRAPGPMGTSDGSNYWAIRRASEIGLNRDDIREAILAWAATLDRPEWASDVRRFALELGVLNADDLPGMPPPDIVSVCPPPSAFERRQGTVEVSTRRPKQAPWVPNEANYPAFEAWYQSQNWDNVAPDVEMQMMQQKMCELGLLHPVRCDELFPHQTTTTSAPAE